MEPTLSSEELDVLLSALEPGADRVPAGARLRRYNFRLPDKFSKDQLRTILMLHDNFARGATTALSAHLRSMVQVNTETVEQTTYRQFTQSVTEPAILAVVAMPPLPARTLWELDPALAFALIDRVLGGPGVWPERSRALTDIEGAVVRRLFSGMLGAWREAWKNVTEIAPRLDTVESNPLFAQVCAPEDIVLVVHQIVELGGRRAPLRICIPYRTLEPVLPRLSAREWLGHEPVRQASHKEAVRHHIYETHIPLWVELGRAEITLRALLALKPGDLLRLDRGPEQPVRLFVGDRPVFRARPGRRGRRLAVTIEGKEHADE
ncbi:MAG: flagellar motor switch protein FliM [Clostridia bacterium]|nr:flagellar motor switch protein FliM [Clostridia bacterium]